MDIDIYGSRYEPIRPHNPWEAFTNRNEGKHGASRLCSPTQTTSEVIDKFLAHERTLLDELVPRRWEVLREFLLENIRQSSDTTGPYTEDIERHSRIHDIALVDDRRRHEDCKRVAGYPCDDCEIFSESMKITELCKRMQKERRSLKAEKRIIFVPNLTPAGALALVATIEKRSAIHVRAFLHRYLGRQHFFSASTAWGFFLEFHISYHAMRRGPLRITIDPRTIREKSLRMSEPLPLSLKYGDKDDLYYHEAQTSSLCWGADEHFWTELFLVDTYFGSEENHKTYLTNCTYGHGQDPPLGGSGNMKRPQFNPREYFLLKIDRRIEQATTEYSALIESFDTRMEEYARSIRRVFEDDNQRSHTKELSNIIDTIQVFVDCISGIVDTWENFSRGEMSLFTTHAPNRLTWSNIISRINHNITELRRLRKLLLTKSERFKFKLDSLHTVSSLLQTETSNKQAKTAITQGNDLKILTKMTVYVAFPLLFTTALFSMDFVRPKYPWAVFFGVLMLTSAMNYMIASQSSPQKLWIDTKEWAVSFFRTVTRF